MAACDAACLCLILHQEMPRQKAIAWSWGMEAADLCILMSAPWEKYANSFCHQEENRGQESSRYRRGLREEGTCKRRDWVEITCFCWMLCMCVVWGIQEQKVSELGYIKETEWGTYVPIHPHPTSPTPLFIPKPHTVGLQNINKEFIFWQTCRLIRYFYCN